MTNFIITPYEPTDDPSKWEALRTASDLKINPAEYKRQLLRKWPDAEFFNVTKELPLQWCLDVKLKDSSVIPGAIGSLSSDLQTISIDTPNTDFFFWHRKVIPNKYKLFLFNTSAWDSLELTSSTTVEEIRKFIAGD
ncbi:MAG: hypothetical protein OEY93_07970 [Anaerolineae bacterium]|nr:hypothetical protein [Anaerolineae bacterium]